MAFVGKLFNAIGSIFSGPQQQQSPIINIAPSPAPVAPARSDATVQAESQRQRRKYATGSEATNLLTGGEGVAPSSTYSAVTALLGGGNATR